LTTF